MLKKLFGLKRQNVRRNRRNGLNVHPRLENLERRNLMAVSIVPAFVYTKPVAAEVVQAPQIDMNFSELLIIGTRDTTPRSLEFKAALGASLTNAGNFDLLADLYGSNGKQGIDGVYETRLANNVQPSGNRVRFSLTGILPNTTSYVVPLRVVGDISQAAIANEKIGFSAPIVEFSTKPMTRADVQYFGAANPVHTVRKSESADIRVTLSGPSKVNELGAATYSMLIGNSGPNAATQVTAVMPIPTGFVYTGTKGTVDSSAATVTFTYGSLPAGQVRAETVEFSVTTNAPTLVSANASVYSSTRDPVITNNMSSTIQTTVVQQNVLTLNLESSSDTIGVNENNHVFGILSGDSTQGDVKVSRISFAIQALDSTGNSLLPIPDLLEGLELRNQATGLVIPATIALSTPDVGVYTVSNAIFKNGDRWEIRGDVEQAYSDFLIDGDRFRVTVVGESSATTRSVNIPGLGMTTDFRLQAVDLDTNIVVESKPGGVLSGNYHTVAIPSLAIVTKGIGTADVAVSNAKNQLFYRFVARANDAEDLLVAGAAFQAEVGSLLNIQNAAWWVDTDNNGETDTILQKGVFSQNGVLTFDHLAGGGYVHPAGDDGVVHEIRADVSASLAADKRLQLALIPDSVTAEILDDGSSLDANQIDVTLDPSKLWTFVPTGSLFVTKSSTPVRQQYLLAGSRSDAPVARYVLEAWYEDIEVTDVAFFAAGNPVSPDRFELVLGGTTQVIATATIGGAGTEPIPAGGKTYWSNVVSRQLIVPKGQAVELLVYERDCSDMEGAKSGDSVRLDLVTTPIFVSVQARGSTSSNVLARNDNDGIAEGEVFIGTNVPAPSQDIIGTANTIVLARLDGILKASPDADGSDIPIGIATVASFKYVVGMHSNFYNGINKVQLELASFVFDTVNVSISTSDVFLFNKSDPTQKVRMQVTTMDGAHITTPTVSGKFRVIATDLALANMDSQIDPGSSETFSIQANILNPQINQQDDALLQVVHELQTGTIWSEDDRGVNNPNRNTFSGIRKGDTLVKGPKFVR